MQPTKHLFVYGSLRSGFKSPAYNYISQYFNFVSIAKAKGILYDMGNYPVAIEDKNENFILGELYEIKEPVAFDFVIAQIDDYEGIDGEEDAVALYERKLSDIYINDKIAGNAFVYWYCGNVANKPIVASGDVLEYFKSKK